MARIEGDNGNNKLKGTEGNGMRGRGGDDERRGDDGDDKLSGGAGADLHLDGEKRDPAERRHQDAERERLHPFG